MSEEKISVEEAAAAAPTDEQFIPPDERETAEDEKKVLATGARGFSLFLLAFGVFFLYHSLKLQKKSPGPTGPAVFPIFLSVSLIILVIVDFLKALKKPVKNAGVPLGQKVRETLQYLFPTRSTVFIAISILYYVLLVLGVPFLVASALFLMGTMCYLIRKSVLKNLLYTAVLLGAIYLIFTMVFKITLP